MPIFSNEAFLVLEALTQNNNKEWFAKNKTRYEDLVLKPFAGLLEQLTVSLSGTAVAYKGDDGIGPRAGRPGFGTDIFDSLTRQWQLVPNPGGGSLLTAET